MFTPNQTITPDIDHNRLTSNHRILLFELRVGGHYPTYVRHLIRYWGEQDLPGRLDILVVPKFMEQHQDVLEVAQNYGSDRVNFVPITAQEEELLGTRTTFIRRKWRYLREWSLLNHYATALGSTQCVVMYFDTYQMSAVLQRQIPCPFSGIYFRSRFHYDDFPQCALSWQDRVRHWQERFHISVALRNPQLKTLFCLDQFAVRHLNQFHRNAKAVYLPDPVQLYAHSESKVNELRISLGIDPYRQVFLLFGVLESRKGIHQLLSAILLLPPTLCQKLCLLLVGPLSSQDKAQVKMQIAQISHLLPIQIILYDQYVIEQENQPFFLLSDVVLAPYQRHVGTSSILIRAAAAQKPVLCSNYGLMGEWTRHYELGITVDSTDKNEIAKSLTRFLLEKPNKLFDKDKAKHFAEQNSSEKFGSVIFRNLLGKLDCNS